VLIDAYCTQLIRVNSEYTDQKPTKFTSGVAWPLSLFNAPISVPMLHGVSEWQHDECRCVGPFSLNTGTQISPVISGVTRQKLTKFLHDVATSSPLLMCTFRQCNSFSSDSAKNSSGISRRSWHFPKSIDCHGNVPRQIGKRGTGLSSAPKVLSYCEKIVKIGPVYPEIFD